MTIGKGFDHCYRRFRLSLGRLRGLFDWLHRLIPLSRFAARLKLFPGKIAQPGQGRSGLFRLGRLRRASLTGEMPMVADGALISPVTVLGGAFGQFLGVEPCLSGAGSFRRLQILSAHVVSLRKSPLQKRPRPSDRTSGAIVSGKDDQALRLRRRSIAAAPRPRTAIVIGSGTASTDTLSTWLTYGSMLMKPTLVVAPAATNE